MSENRNTEIKHPIMGAKPDARGVSFRVWAPHAEKVYITGTFNNWSKSSTALIRGKNDYWSADVPDAKTGDEYRYLQKLGINAICFSYQGPVRP